MQSATLLAWNPSNQSRFALFWTILRTHFAVVFVSVLLYVLLVLYYGLALWGWLRQQTKNSAAILLLLTAFYLIFVAGGAAGMARYRYPVLPIVCIFAGMGLAHVCKSRCCRCKNTAEPSGNTE